MSLLGMELLNHLTPMLGIVTGVLISLTVTHRRSEARNATDAARLRAALQIELAMLRSSYQDNLEQLDAGTEFLPSWRQMTTLYRANLSRLILLTESEVAALVAAYGQVEVIESYLATVCKPAGQVYRVLGGETPVDAMRQRFSIVQTHLTAAMAALAPSGRLKHSAFALPPFGTSMRTRSSPAAQAAQA